MISTSVINHINNHPVCTTRMASPFGAVDTIAVAAGPLDKAKRYQVISRTGVVVVGGEYSEFIYVKPEHKLP